MPCSQGQSRVKSYVWVVAAGCGRPKSGCSSLISYRCFGALFGEDLILKNRKNSEDSSRKFTIYRHGQQGFVRASMLRVLLLVVAPGMVVQSKY